MPDPIEVEVVEIDGAPPPPESTSRPEADWFRFDRRFVRRSSSPLSWLLGGLLAVVLLSVGLLALAGFVIARIIGGFFSLFRPSTAHRGGSLSSR